MNHLSLLIDAMHILCSKRISQQELETAGRLLSSFTENFEILYGQSNVVFNIHLARHLTDCVKFLGPLFAYSNYPFEDNIGHLISLQNGTTDVTTQICGKYIMEKNLAQILPNSTIATEFYKEIDSKHKYPNSTKIEGNLLIGRERNVSGDVLSFIVRILNLEDSNLEDIIVNEYNAVLMNSNVFYEASHCVKKRTDDTFIFNLKSNKFAIIKKILVIADKLFFFINEKFDIVQDENRCKSIIYLKNTEFSDYKIIESEFVGPKFAYVQFDDVKICAKFPNMIERN